MNVETDFCQWRIVVALEGIEVVGTHLGASVSAPQVVLEENSHLLHHRVAVLVARSSHLEGGDKIFLTVGAHLADRKLRTGDDDRLVQVFEHETQRRRGESHGVGAVKHHEAIEIVVVILNGSSHIAPVRRSHGSTVDGRIELDIVNLEIEHLDFRHIVDKMREVERLQRMCHRVLNHSDCAAGVDDEDFRSR